MIETINMMFGLPALASLPDEAQALQAGNSAEFNKFGPARIPAEISRTPGQELSYQ